MRWFRLACRFAALAVLFAGSVAAAAERTQVVVYSTLEPDFVGELKKAFEADNPDIEIVWQRDSTGVITARLLAERGERGDAIWGLAATSMMRLKKEALLKPHAPPNLAEIRPNFRDAETPPAWVGMEAWAAAVCFNTAEAEKLGLPKPASWYDLLDPRFRGRITMPDPGSSGTGYFHVSAWLQLFGEEEAWRFMDRLHLNIATYEHSGTKPCRNAAAGEFPVGISYELAGAQVKEKGAPVDVLLMKEGGGWDMDAAGILSGTRNPEAARRLVDFAASRKANEIYARFIQQVAIEGIAKPIRFYPEGVAASMIKNDLVWAAENRERIIAEWARRYGRK
ncbi:MAG: putative 2-aminoethylphosphonate ABC transporter substrate-binding protein [Microvirga sp.]